AGAYAENTAAPPTTLTYLDEASYFVPVLLALNLQTAGEFTASLDWLRTVYDDRQPPRQRVIAALLHRDTGGPVTFTRAADWLRDPLNPHAIAATRAGTYTRFTLLTIIHCLMDFADAQFTDDTAESLPRARTLYLAALSLLETDELRQRTKRCADIIGTLDIT